MTLDGELHVSPRAAGAFCVSPEGWAETHSAVAAGAFDRMTMAIANLKAARPEFCRGCGMEAQCLGGCKAAAEVCCGSPSECDPFLAAFRARAVKPI